MDILSQKKHRCLEGENLNIPTSGLIIHKYIFPGSIAVIDRNTCYGNKKHKWSFYFEIEVSAKYSNLSYFSVSGVNTAYKTPKMFSCEITVCWATWKTTPDVRLTYSSKVITAQLILLHLLGTKKLKYCLMHRTTRLWFSTECSKGTKQP